ncbi:sigma 54 modulation/S30EA ribosomal C-terminal domain-containing protein [Streptomyces kebangsaanensis]|uniref:sigma 54 modulation/S30EA ribosomal C-terminal domain-containing protein n=1 Tax=Streptomyces kebangsaanensis TaxID=864058 RepID=UPI00093B9F54|nr:sigma 54 modulation/S30EA ribosomal C-terminal domain-containing protein [Streptomyces kebangsaanensis]
MGNSGSHRPDRFPRPVEERRVVRHEPYAPTRETPDEAAFEPETTDYDFHLLTDIGTGEDSTPYRSGPTGYRLAQVHPRPRPVGPVAVPLTVGDLPAPRMTPAEAEQRLDIGGLPFVFFADAAAGRGNVLYRRYEHVPSAPPFRGEVRGILPLAARRATRGRATTAPSDDGVVGSTTVTTA